MNGFLPRRVLTIDRGNSSMKAVVWDEESVVCARRLFDVSVEALLPLLDEYAPEGCAFCSVGHADAKFLETLRRLLDGRMLVLTPSTPLPIGIRYASRDTLGADRVAAAAGAAALFPGEGALVVDAGTAVTLDVIDAGGVFAGGNIAPGMSLRFRSLHEFTDRLPLVSPEGDVPVFGYDTVTAIRAGVVGGMIAEIADAFGEARRNYGATRIVATGNDAAVLVGGLGERGLRVDSDPNLVGRGLLHIFRHAMRLMS